MNPKNTYYRYGAAIRVYTSATMPLIPDSYKTKKAPNLLIKCLLFALGSPNRTKLEPLGGKYQNFGRNILTGSNPIRFTDYCDMFVIPTAPFSNHFLHDLEQLAKLVLPQKMSIK